MAEEQECKVPKFNQQIFNKFVIDKKIFGFYLESKPLKSGRKSHFYINWRPVISDVYSLKEELVPQVVSFMNGHFGLYPDTVYGVPLGASLLGAFVQAHCAAESDIYGPGSHILVQAREKSKRHGDAKDRDFVGIPGGNTVIVEDVVSTGETVIKEIKKCQNTGVKVCAVLSLTDRNERNTEGKTVREALAELGIKYYAMSNALELLPILIKKERPVKAIVDSIVTEFEEYGERALIL
jgi:orotate phosphoribosyltransferase